MSEIEKDMKPKETKDRNKQAEQELVSILFTMEVPLHRLQSKDWKWLITNLAARNLEHPKLTRVTELLTGLLGTSTVAAA